MPKRSTVKYTSETLKNAVQAVHSGKAINATARRFGIPRTTLYENSRGKVTATDRAHRHGPDRLLSDTQESSLIRYCQFMGQRGFPLNRKCLRLLALEIIKKSGRQTTVNQQRGPSNRWCRKFLQRHPEIRLRTPDPVDHARLELSSQQTDQYFALLQQTLATLNLFNKPNQIFNCDESGLSGKERSKTKVLVHKGDHPYQLQPASHDHLSLHLAISAGGDILPPFIIFKKSLPRQSFIDNIPDSWLFGVSEKGYMNNELFLDWFSKIFIPNCGRDRPVLLIMDNLSSHLNPDVIDLAKENNIELLCLPAHSSHLLQPLDNVFFLKFKSEIKSMCTSLGYARATVDKARTPTLIRHVLKKIPPSVIINSFSSTGIHPFNPDKVKLPQTLLSSSVPSASNNHPTSSTDLPIAHTSSHNSFTETNTEPPNTCGECGSYLENPLVRLGLIPPELSDILLPPPPKQNKRPNTKKLLKTARVITAEELRVFENTATPEHNSTITQHSDTVEYDDDEVCQVCMTQDRGEWVGCDGCPRWYHYHCLSSSARVDVDLSLLVNDSKWSCQICQIEQ